MLPRRRQPTPSWQQRPQAEWREYAALISRFEQRLLAAIDAHDAHSEARRAAAHAALAVQQANYALAHTRAACSRADAAVQRTAELAAFARRVRRDVRRRLLLTAIGVPVVFAGWLALALALTGR